jgi:crotonobetainyl-CoA:carnitine CoA-transferase CaiB-like acyl-CoA transferase
MLTSTGYLVSNDLVAVDGETAPVIADGDQLGAGPFYRLYPCAGERADGGPTWLLVAAVSARDVARLGDALGLDLGADPADRTIERISARTGERTAAEWSKLLAEREVPHAVADEDGFESWLERHGMLEPAHHADFGEYWRVLPRIRYGARVAGQGVACRIGEHSVALLAELGFDADAVETMVAAGAVGR